MVKANDVNLGIMYNSKSEMKNIVIFCEMLEEGRVFDIVNRKSYNRENIKTIVNMGPILKQRGYTNEDGILDTPTFRERIATYTQNIDEGKQYVAELHVRHPELMNRKSDMQTNKRKVLTK